MSNISVTTRAFERLVSKKGASILWHRENGQFTYPCSCRTPEGFRDPDKHLAVNRLIKDFSVVNGITFPALSVVHYLVVPLVISQRDSVLREIGPGLQQAISVGSSPSDIQLQFQIPAIFVNILQSINVYRSVGDLNHFEFVQNINSSNLLWTDTHPIGPGTDSLVDVDIPLCNDDGFVPDVIEKIVKGFVQPAFIGLRSRSNQIMIEAFGEVQSDDHIGIFPLEFGNYKLDFTDWSDAGSDWLEFNGMRFIAVTSNQVPAPDNANLNHHWEVALRRINEDVRVA